MIFQQMPKKVSQGHYGSRLIFRGDGTLFVTLGERQMPISPANEAQSLTSQLGKVVRINTDGSIPADNPYASMRTSLRRPSGATVTAIRRPPHCIRRLASCGSPSTGRRVAMK